MPTGTGPAFDRARNVVAFLVTLVLLLTLLSVAANTQTTSGTEPITITRIMPGEGVRQIWDSVVACSGDRRDTTKTFEEIKFFERTPIVLQGDSLLGEWVSPDSIFLTEGYEYEGWIVAHEMLHHALNGPPTGNPHPLDPFLFPCRLLLFQHRPGGIMGKGTHSER